jgi:hypothetical protein
MKASKEWPDDMVEGIRFLVTSEEQAEESVIEVKAL